MILKSSKCAQKQRVVFFEETKSDHYDKLIPTPLFRELIEEDKT